jgi:hypothetical protein
MKKLSIGLLLAGAVLTIGSLLPTKPVIIKDAKAATAIMCQGDVSGASTGSRTVGGTGSQVPSQTLYVLNGAGCASIQQADVGYFLSQGYTSISGLQPIIFTTGVATGTTDFVIGNLPANAYIASIIMANATANAVTGGVSIGSTANGTDIVAATTCAANCVANSTLVKTAFSTTAQTALHAAAVTAWNSANVTITVNFGAF